MDPSCSCRKMHIHTTPPALRHTTPSQSDTHNQCTNTRSPCTQTHIHRTHATHTPHTPLSNRIVNENQVRFCTRAFSSSCGKLTTGQRFLPAAFCTCSTCDVHRSCHLKTLDCFRSSPHKVRPLRQDIKSFVLNTKTNIMEETCSQNIGP